MNHLITLAACLTLTALLHAQTIVYVTPTGTGDGTSWANACNLENAVRTKDVSPLPGTQIWVQKGTYYPSKMLVIPDSVKIYGGFAGTEANLSQRNFSANPTIVDGQDKIGSIFRLENSAEINGFTIQNGNANGNPYKNGGGVWADENSIIENCKIINNTAMQNGGGVYANGKVRIINNTIEHNTANGNGANLFGHCFISGAAQGGTVGTTPVFNTHPSTIVQTKGINEPFPTLYVSVTSPTPAYQWYSNTANNNITGMPILDATEASYMPPSRSISDGAIYYYCKVSSLYGTVSSNVSGAQTVSNFCNSNTPGFGSLGTVGFASATTRTITGNGITQIWSDAVTATGCNKTSFSGGSSGSFNADCRSNPGYPGDLFSWCAVVRYADVLCPAPWRVPTGQDCIDLDIAMGGTGMGTAGLSMYVGTGANQWGGVYGGRSEPGGSLMAQSTFASYWSLKEQRADAILYLYYHRKTGETYPQCGSGSKYFGYTLRCVR